MAALTSFVPSEEVKKLTLGSYEHLRSQLESAIEKSKERLFGSDAPVQVLGTFSGYAVLLSEDAKVYRVKFEQNDRGEIIPLGSEQLSVPAYKPSTIGDFALREAKAYVEAFLDGSKTLAMEHLKNLLPVVREKAPAPVPAKLTEAFENLVRGERGWKKVYTERQAQIRSAVEEEFTALEENRTKEKFRRLYDGSMSISESEAPAYRELVTSDLTHLAERFDSILADTEKAVSTFKGAVPAMKPEEKDATVRMFESFSEDFLADVRGVKKALVEANNLLNSVDDFGKIYDVLASELHRYEVAGKFVGKMSRQLAKSSATEEG